MTQETGISRRELIRAGGAAAVGAGGLAGVSGTAVARGFGFRDREKDVRPVVFVHGGFGSATQFESQAMRFTTNGYPDSHLAAYEYNTFVDFQQIEAQVMQELDSLIDEVRDRTGKDQVDAIGHSRGTTVLFSYLSDPERAEKVANYVNIDGREAGSPPGGVRTLAVWGMGNPDAEIGGAENVHFDGQTHVEVATSRESFTEIYGFLTGEEPVTSRIKPEVPDEVTLSGRALLFPFNEGVSDASLEIYRIDPDSAERLTEEPDESTELESDGSWGPFSVDPLRRYEFVLRREDAQNHHFYRFTPIRSNGFVRLLTSEPGSLLDQIIDRGPNHSTFSITRDKEWWGDQEDMNDELSIDSTNIINAATAPQDQNIVSPQVYDQGADGESDVSQPIPLFGGLPFITGVDLFVGASSPPDTSVELVSTPRDGGGLRRRVATRNWASDEDLISVHFPDHEQWLPSGRFGDSPGLRKAVRRVLRWRALLHEFRL